MKLSISFLNGDEIMYQWIIDENISWLLKLNNIPIDPKTWDFIKYSLSQDQKEYQLWFIFENKNISSLGLNKSYASNWYYSVRWQYNWLLLSNNNWILTLYNLPSLLVETNSGNIDSENTKFLMNNQSIEDDLNIREKMSLAWSVAQSLTWIIVKKGCSFLEQNWNTLVMSLWYDLDKIAKEINWERFNISQECPENNIITWYQEVWWYCSWVDNSIWENFDISTCTDTREYNHFAEWATHSWVYSIIKLDGEWWMNQNLAYTLEWTKYRDATAWSTTDLWLYSCPWQGWSTPVVRCDLVWSRWYLYQFSTAMNGSPSVDGKDNRIQWLCPTWWEIPTRSDFVSPEVGWLWPTEWPSGHTGWTIKTTSFNRTAVGYRWYSNTFYWGDALYLMTSTLWSWNVWRLRIWPTPSIRYNDWTHVNFGISLRCIKN